MRPQRLLRNIVRDEQGSSSILVIILMVVLMVFGLAVLTTSLSNLRLAEKKRDWLQGYYDVEAHVETRLALIDQLLLEAEAAAMNYMDSGMHIDDYMLDEPLNADESDLVYQVVYMDMANEMILEHIAGDTDATLTVNSVDMDELFMGGSLEASILEFDTTLSDTEYPKHITVTLAIEPPMPETTDGDGRLFRRFSISKYLEWQEPFEYEDGFDFDDPFSEDEDTGNPFDEDDNPLQDNPFSEDD